MSNRAFGCWQPSKTKARLWGENPSSFGDNHRRRLCPTAGGDDSRSPSARVSPRSGSAGRKRGYGKARRARRLAVFLSKRVAAGRDAARISPLRVQLFQPEDGGCCPPPSRRDPATSWSGRLMNGAIAGEFRVGKDVNVRICGFRCCALSEQAQLLAHARRRLEEIATQRRADSPKAEPCRRRLEPAPDHRGVGTRPRHPRAKR